MRSGPWTGRTWQARCCSTWPNPLDFPGPVVGLDPVGYDSLGESIQREFPAARVVNTMAAALMVDLGDLSAARGMEAYLLLWLRLMGVMGGPRFNIAINRAPA